MQRKIETSGTWLVLGLIATFLALGTFAVLEARCKTAGGVVTNVYGCSK